MTMMTGIYNLRLGYSANKAERFFLNSFIDELRES